MTTEPICPDVTVPLIGEDGNAFFIIGRVSRALKDSGYYDVATTFSQEAFSSTSYDQVIQTVLKYVATK